jgi:hypothetical protein
MVTGERCSPYNALRKSPSANFSASGFAFDDFFLPRIPDFFLTTGVFPFPPPPLPLPLPPLLLLPFPFDDRAPSPPSVFLPMLEEVPLPLVMLGVFPCGLFPPCCWARLLMLRVPGDFNTAVLLLLLPVG